MKLDPCGCCDASVPPLELFNRPGLPALAYRIGTHPAFLRRMLARLATHYHFRRAQRGRPATGPLTTRATDDPSIALLDAWATVADVLTFYQERHRQRGLPAHRHRAPFGPGVGADDRLRAGPGRRRQHLPGVHLGDAAGRPPVVIVPIGTKVQSIPGPGQLPQTFETTEEIEARRNGMLCARARPNPSGSPSTTAVFFGTRCPASRRPVALAAGPCRRSAIPGRPGRASALDDARSRLSKPLLSTRPRRERHEPAPRGRSAPLRRRQGPGPHHARAAGPRRDGLS